MEVGPGGYLNAECIWRRVGPADVHVWRVSRTLDRYVNSQARLIHQLPTSRPSIDIF